jgi:hypothetical protein
VPKAKISRILVVVGVDVRRLPLSASGVSLGDRPSMIASALWRLAHLLRVGSAIVDARCARLRRSTRTDNVRVGIVLLILADEAR